MAGDVDLGSIYRGETGLVFEAYLFRDGRPIILQPTDDVVFAFLYAGTITPFRQKKASQGQVQLNGAQALTELTRDDANALDPGDYTLQVVVLEAASGAEQLLFTGDFSVLDSFIAQV